MDIGVVLFAGILLLAGILLIISFITSMQRERRSEELHSDEELRVLYQQAARTQRRMERQRFRIWSRMDEFYEQLLEKSVVREHARMLLPPEVTSPGDCVVEVEEGSDFTLADVQESYEVFIRKAE